MSDEGDTKPDAPPPSSTQALKALRVALEHRRQRAMRFFLHVRYVFGYLAAGFLVSVPLSLGMKVGSGLSVSEAFAEGGLSIGYGLVLLVPFAGLWPFSRIDWKAMRVPEFQLFELAVTRTATFAALILCLLSIYLRGFTEHADPRLAWMVFMLMLVAWGRIKMQTRLFPEFYSQGDAAGGPPATKDQPE
jgi:hypothetical protein